MEIDYREIVNLDFWQGKGIVSSLERPDQLCCLPSRLLNAYRRYSTRWLKLTTRLQQVSRFRTCVFVPPLRVCLYGVSRRNVIFTFYLNLKERKNIMFSCQIWLLHPVAYPGILFGGGVQQIQLRTEDWENGDLGAVAP